jgi:tRNA pseudouridine38-40 synthase
MKAKVVINVSDNRGRENVFFNRLMLKKEEVPDKITERSQTMLFSEFIYICPKAWFMPRYFIKLSYKGTAYHGWQAQNNAITVQQILTDAVSMMLGRTVELTGCGRTDTGVHALEFYAHFDLEKELTPAVCSKLVHRLNSYLPKDIAIAGLFSVPDDLHARFSATARTYKYYITRRKDPFRTDYVWHHPAEIDVGMMNKGAQMLMGFSDFSCFSKSHTQTKTNLCRMFHAEWEESPDGLVFTISADRFLRNMVRAVVGTLMEMGRGRLDEKGLEEIVLSKQRSKAGKSVPACGLFLVKVEYPFDFNV